MGPLLPSLLFAAALGGFPPGEAGKLHPLVAQLHPGMTDARVRLLLGPPRRVARQIIYKRCLEQWIYDAPFSVRIELDCVQGRQSRILTVHPIISPQP